MDDKVFNLLEKMYGELTNKIDGLTNELKEFKQETKEELKTIKNQLTTMEHDNNEHFKALYDGYKQSIEGIKAIKEEVARHEEVIIKRVK